MSSANHSVRARVVTTVAETYRAERSRRMTEQMRAAAERAKVVTAVTDVAKRTLAERAERLQKALADDLARHEEIGAPPPLLELLGIADEETSYNALLGWILDPEKAGNVGRVALRSLAVGLEFPALVRAIDGNEGLQVLAELPWPEGGFRHEPDILVLAPGAILLLENKLHSGESGDQFGPYRRALTDLATARNVPPNDARAHLLDPKGIQPAEWHRTVSHIEFSSWMMRAAEAAGLALWDRLACILVAEAFAAERSVGERVRQGRALAERLSKQLATHADIGNVAKLLPLPAPLDPRRPS